MSESSKKISSGSDFVTPVKGIFDPIDKKTFLKSYRRRNLKIYVAFFLGFLCLVVGLMILSDKILNLRLIEIPKFVDDLTANELIYLAIGGIILVIGAVFVMVAIGIRNGGNEAYSLYLSEFYRNKQAKEKEWSQKQTEHIQPKTEQKSNTNCWTCPVCGNYNINRDECFICSEPNPAIDKKTTKHHSKKINPWYCPYCGQKNAPTDLACLCGKLRPKINVWYCPKCGTPNSGDACTSCGQKYPRK